MGRGGAFSASSEPRQGIELLMRWYLPVAACVVTGSLINVLATWALAVGTKSQLTDVDYQSIAVWPAADFHPKCKIPDMMSVRSESSFQTNLTTIGGARNQVQMAQIVASRFGWPARSLQYTEWRETGRDDFKQSLQLPSWVASKLPGGGRLPIGPIWLGFAVNTLLYAALGASLWLAPDQLRLWHRRRQGLCIHCSYPVADPAKPCSECGRLPTTR